MANQQQQAAEYELYKRIKLLGEGAFGKAYLVEDLRTHEMLVQKQMDMKAMSADEKRETQKEAKILQQLNHPNIVKFKDVYTTKKGKLCIIMEYADGGDLAKIVKEARGKFLQEKQILDWFTQICLAMKHVHDRKIIHRDLKGQNIFLTRNSIVKLGDFGIARVLSKTMEKAKTMVGTPYYLSPEIIESKPYSFKTDIWSLGVILYELCALKPPFNADSLHFLALKIVKGQYSPIPNHFSREMKNLIANLLQVDSVRRPSIHDIMKMPIIQDRVKNFLSETIRQVEFSHTILHNKKIDAKVNLAEIKMVNQEAPCPPHLLQQYMKKDEKDSNQQQQPASQQKPPVSQQQPAVQPSQQQASKGGNFHYNKPSNPVANYVNNYRPPSAKNDVRPNIGQQQQQQQAAQQELERKKEMERQRQEKERQMQQAELEKKRDQERIRQEKEKLAFQKLEQERDARMKRLREQELKEKQQQERERELQRIAIENKQQQQKLLLQQQYNSAPQKRDDVQAGGMAVFGNPNFKPAKQNVPVKNIQLAPSKAVNNPPKSGGEHRSNSKPAIARSGSNSHQQQADKKLAQQKKEDEAKQRLNEQKILRQKSEQEKRDYESRLQREKEEESQKKKEENQKKIIEQREQMKKDRTKWQKGGEVKVEFVGKKAEGSQPNSNNQLSDNDNNSNNSNEQHEQKQKVQPKKWNMPPKGANNKKNDWEVEIFESKKKPVQSKLKQKSEEALEEYNSDSEQKQQKLVKKVSKTEKDLDEYNSEEEDFNNRKQDITAQDIPEEIDQDISRLPEVVKEETYLQKGGDNTTFNIDIDMNNPNQIEEYLKDLQSIVDDAKGNVDKLHVDDKYARNNMFDFTKTQKTKKFSPSSGQSKESLTTQDEDPNLNIRDDDLDEPDPSFTGKFLEGLSEPPVLQNKIMAKDEEESLNIIGSGIERFQELLFQVEEELQDHFHQAYQIMQKELMSLDYDLGELEKKYQNNRYKEVLNFLTDEQIEKYLRLIITLVCMEEKFHQQNQ